MSPFWTSRVAKQCRRSWNLKSSISALSNTFLNALQRFCRLILVPILLKNTRSFLVLRTFDLAFRIFKAIRLSGRVFGFPFFVFWIRIVLRSKSTLDHSRERSSSCLSPVWRSKITISLSHISILLLGLIE
jgi:hypothetical protein